MTRRPAVILATLATAAGLLLAPAGAAALDDPPSVSAPSAVVMEASTGDVTYSRGADKRRAIASTTKLMTALLTMEHAKLDEVVPAANYIAAPAESQLGLRPGDRLTVADLLRGLMLESANDAAETLGEYVGGSRIRFVRMMNRRARELDLTNTHFANPIGLDAPSNYSSARDLARLAIALREHSFIRKIADRESATLTSYGDKVIRNRNTLLGKDPRVNGLKTGHTLRAGYVLVGTRTANRVTVVSVVLGTSGYGARDTDSLNLLKWGTAQYRRVRPILRGTAIAEEPVIRYRRGATLPLLLDGTVTRVVRRDADITMADRDVPKEVAGPIRAGQRMGYREVFADGERIAAVPIVSSSSVPAADLPQRTKDWFTRPLAILVAAIILGGTVLMARRLRRPPPRRETTRSEPEAA
jgi:serine-type D-Ala-D-Ala carboxypeptidase (penicillin-binding protein 5/6)